MPASTDHVKNEDNALTLTSRTTQIT